MKLGLIGVLRLVLVSYPIFLPPTIAFRTHDKGRVIPEPKMLKLLDKYWFILLYKYCSHLNKHTYMYELNPRFIDFFKMTE